SACLLRARVADIASNRALPPAGESWNESDGMWQSAHARPFPPSSLRLRSLNAARPRATSSHGELPQLSFVAPFPWAMAGPVLALQRTLTATSTLPAQRHY